MKLWAKQKEFLRAIGDDWTSIVLRGHTHRTLKSLNRHGLIEIRPDTQATVWCRRTEYPAVRPVVGDAERLEIQRRLFSYDPESGALSRRTKHGLEPVARTISTVGYLRVWVNPLGRYLQAHRVCWELFHDLPIPAEIDHVNAVKLDNRIVNLRLATPSQNHSNRRSLRNLPRPKGVGFDSNSKSNKWRAHLRMNKDNFPLGRYPTQDEAAHAYNKAAIIQHGEFAVLNPVGVRLSVRASELYTSPA